VVRVGISVEGVTEERFVKMVLLPYLLDRQVYVTPIPMGGGVTLAKVTAELKNFANDFNFVSTFYDFYGFKGKAANETKDTLEQRIREHAHDSIQERLIPYVQMYEFEGLLFSSPQAIANNMQDQSLVEWAQSILKGFNANPEKINDSNITAPSKRLEEKTIYRKTTHGPNIAREIGIDVIRQRCAGFHAWLDNLEKLAP